MKKDGAGPSRGHKAASTVSRTPPGAALPVKSRKGSPLRRFEAIVELAPDATIVAGRDGRMVLVNRQTEALFGYTRKELLGQPVELLIPKRFHAAHLRHRAEYAAAPKARPMSAGLQLFGLRRDGSEFPVEVSFGPLGEEDDWQVIVSIRDVSETQRVLAANRELQQLLAVTDTALSHLELDDLLPALLDRVLEVLAVDHASIQLLDDTERMLFTLAARGLDADAPAPKPIAVGQGVAGRIAATRQPLIVDDLSKFPVVSASLFERQRSAVGVPVMLRERLLGVLIVSTTESRRFTEHDAQLLVRVAERVGTSIERARLYEAEQRARLRATARSAELEAVLGGMTDSVAVFDAGGKITYVNAAYRTMLALDAQPDFERLSVTERAHLFHARTSTGEPLSMEQLAGSRLLHGEVLLGSESSDLVLDALDGRTVTVQVAGSPLRDASGQLTGAVLVMRDVTEERRFEREARDLAAHLQSTLDAMSDAVFLFDAQGRLLRLNTAAQAMLDARSATAAFYSQPLRERGAAYQLHWPDGRPVAQEDWPITRVLRGEVLTEVNVQEIVVPDARGRERVMTYVGGPAADAAGNPVGYVLVLRDVTERKRLEREREEAHASALAAREVAQQLDQFFAMASHDIRSPLTALSGNLQMAHARARRLGDTLQSRDEESAELVAPLMTALDRADGSLESVLRLVSLLFDVARARTGTLTLTPAPCDLGALLRKQVEAQRAAVPERSIQLELPDEPVRVVADAVRLEQVLTNYLTNALKYSPDHCPVQVRLEVTEGLAVVAVRDHGPGLPWEEQSRIWELYHRAPGVEVQGTAGTGNASLGLGLHICKRLIELHSGGQVGVESVVGDGSTFWFRLPLATMSQAGVGQEGGTPARVQ
jgi:PAS domain S-box-containing protein